MIAMLRMSERSAMAMSRLDAQTASARWRRYSRGGVDQKVETPDGAKSAVPSPASAAKVIVVMPARNAAPTLERTFSLIPHDIVDEVILVDDKSTDATIEVARKLPVHLIWHPHNVGYGGNQKTCYLEALQRGADVVVMLHPDGQYEPSLIPSMVRS